MKPDINPELKKLLTSLCNKKLTTTYPTMKKYIETGDFPDRVCMNIERVTNGRITANQLRPGMFDGLPADEKLARTCLTTFTEQIEAKNFTLLIAVLDFMQVRQPKLYKEMIEQMESLKGGDIFLAQRVAYRPHGKI